MWENPHSQLNVNQMLFHIPQLYMLWWVCTLQRGGSLATDCWQVPASTAARCFDLQRHLVIEFGTPPSAAAAQTHTDCTPQQSQRLFTLSGKSAWDTFRGWSQIPSIKSLFQLCIYEVTVKSLDWGSTRSLLLLNFQEVLWRKWPKDTLVFNSALQKNSQIRPYFWLFVNVILNGPHTVDHLMSFIFINK